MKTKLFLALGVTLRRCRPEHVEANGGRQHTVLVRARSKKAAMEALRISPSYARHCGLHQRGEGDKVGDYRLRDTLPTLGEVAREEGVVYYCPRPGNEWFRAVGEA